MTAEDTDKMIARSTEGSQEEKWSLVLNPNSGKSFKADYKFDNKVSGV